jgi:hypothetical protein
MSLSTQCITVRSWSFQVIFLSDITPAGLSRDGEYDLGPNVRVILALGEFIVCLSLIVIQHSLQAQVR